MPELCQLSDVDVAISGGSPEVTLPIPPKYHLHGVGFTLGTGGGIDYLASLRSLKLPTVLKEIESLPVQEYDLVINDFEPVSARAALRAGVPSISLSHQAAFLSPETPRPQPANAFYEFVMRRYARCPEAIGVHFQRYDDFIETPIIRREVRELEPRNLGHYTVYLPSYGEEFLCRQLNKIPDTEWQVFGKNCQRARQEGNVLIQPISNRNYLESLATCRGLLCGAGFEAPAEALYLGKNLLVIPLRGQYEQLCNAAALKALGFPYLKELSPKTLPLVEEWAKHAQPTSFDFPHHTRHILESIVRSHQPVPVAVNL